MSTPLLHQTIGFSHFALSLTASSSPLQQSYTSGLPSWAERQKQRWNLVKWGQMPGVWYSGESLPCKMEAPLAPWFYQVWVSITLHSWGQAADISGSRCLKKKKQTKSFKWFSVFKPTLKVGQQYSRREEWSKKSRIQRHTYTCVPTVREEVGS